MQIKQQQSIVGPLICARSWVKFPNVLRDVHCAIRETSDSRRCRRGEESAALKDGDACQLFTVKLILCCLLHLLVSTASGQCLPSFVFLCLLVCGRNQKHSCNSAKATLFIVKLNP